MLFRMDHSLSLATMAPSLVALIMEKQQGQWGQLWTAFLPFEITACGGVTLGLYGYAAADMADTADGCKSYNVTSCRIFSWQHPFQRLPSVWG